MMWGRRDAAGPIPQLDGGWVPEPYATEPRRTYHREGRTVTRVEEWREPYADPDQPADRTVQKSWPLWWYRLGRVAWWSGVTLVAAGALLLDVLGALLAAAAVLAGVASGLVVALLRAAAGILDDMFS